MTTQTIPTDRSGNVYYGPKTYAEGIAKVDQIMCDQHDMPHDDMPKYSDVAASVVAEMNAAGYVIAANRLAKSCE